MPFNGTGGFIRLHTWVNEAAVSIPILPGEFDEQEQDFAVAGFGNCITRDGQGGPTADIPWNNFGITGLRAPVLGGDAANKTYVVTAAENRSMGGYILSNVAAPVAGGDAVNLTTLLARAMNSALPGQSVTTISKVPRSDGTNANWQPIAGNDIYTAINLGGF